MILADQCVYGRTIQLLREKGFDVITLREVGSITLPDSQVLQLAVKADRILLTNDRGFGNILTYPPETHRGIIVLKISAETESAVHRVLLTLLEIHDREFLQQQMCVVDGHKYRFRR